MVHSPDEKGLRAYEMARSAYGMVLRGPRGMLLRRPVVSIPHWLPPSPAPRRSSDKS